MRRSSKRAKALGASAHASSGKCQLPGSFALNRHSPRWLRSCQSVPHRSVSLRPIPHHRALTTGALTIEPLTIGALTIEPLTLPTPTITPLPAAAVANWAGYGYTLDVATLLTPREIHGAKAVLATPGNERERALLGFTAAIVPSSAT